MDLDFDVQSTYKAPLAAPTPAPAADSDLLPFDLGSLSLDLGEPAGKAAAAEPAAEPEADDPLATKLALAEEFQAIGDDDGARALAEEVLAEATGPLKAQAQRFLAALG
jgi:pilus assembly protein FimV